MNPTPFEMLAAFGAKEFAGRNWHNLSGTEQSMITILEQEGYLTVAAKEGFVGAVTDKTRQVLERAKPVEQT